MNTAIKILATVNAPYGVDMTADANTNINSVDSFNAPVFSFFSEVSPALQMEFINEMGVDKGAAAAVAAGFQELAGYDLPLAA
ncbi:hypothetical protein [Labrenzia sp. OB1]|uniref:hypothetical protein n=1 Tax=Labrenzia sp. OB1 TaxID=1561204 RepID=UPI0007B1FD04|nr:hypothetical protein [Labrenzia sp. OB1]KZM48917.1 hypothetical protein OA90_17820 [Labrenzia sp. OB1]